MTAVELKLLRSELSFGSGVFMLIASFISFAALILLLINSISIPICALLLAGGGLLGWAISKNINKKINLDLKNQEIKNLKLKVIRKETISDVEPGSGKLYIPILGDLFPKLWGQKMKQINRTVIHTSDGVRFEIGSELADTIQNETWIECRYAKESDLFLGVTPIN